MLEGEAVVGVSRSLHHLAEPAGLGTIETPTIVTLLPY